MALFTIGHSNRTWAQFVEIVRAHGIDYIADIRGGRAMSRTFPYFNTEEFAKNVPLIGHVGYERVPSLGGRRSRSKVVDHAVNGAFRVEAFQNYADYAYVSDEFDAGVERLLELSEDHNVAYMCSEAVPWRCHRSIVTDYMTLIHKKIVKDILGKTQTQLAKPHGFAKVSGSKVIFPSVDYEG